MGIAIKKVLTIAGSDPSGGAGIQADIRTFSVLGVYSASVITSLTSQNTEGVHLKYDLPPYFVERQLDALLNDIDFDAVKIGMLSNVEILKIISKQLTKTKPKYLVLDPVIASKDGFPLFPIDAINLFNEYLINLATLITPNIYEAETITGMTIKDMSQMKKAALKMKEKGWRNVLIKGGHIKTAPNDILLTEGGDSIIYEGKRINNINTHGSGCVYSSAICAYLAMGNTLKDAVYNGKDFITKSIFYSDYKIGKGYSPVNSMYKALAEDKIKTAMIKEMKEAIDLLKRHRIGSLIPEVSSNLGYATQLARGEEDILAIPGRILRLGDDVYTLSAPEFGASRHVASILLAIMRYDYDKKIRSCMNIKYSEEIIDICKVLRFSIASFSRSNEPKRIKESEGRTLSWGIDKVLRHSNRTPDIIYDTGGMGKEPMIRVFGENPLVVVKKVTQINERYQS